MSRTTNWALVPMVATPEMDAAGKQALEENGVDNVDTCDALLCYTAMLAAAPTNSRALAEEISQGVATALYGPPPHPDSNSLTRAMQLPVIRRAVAAHLTGADA